MTYKCERCGGTIDTHYEHRCPDQAELDDELADRDSRIDDLEADLEDACEEIARLQQRVKRLEEKIGLEPLDEEEDSER